ncbi:MAG: endonuclease/exonuclease/phosphatase family protein [Bacteroidota bacterium]
MKKLFLSTLFFCFIAISAFSQIDTVKTTPKLVYEYLTNFSDAPRSNSIRIGFYNMENMYDTENDSLKSDDDFTPDGANRWSKSRYWKKINNMARVISTIGGWDAPDIMGMCEVENLKVVKNLIFSEPLKKTKYRIIHYDSPDNRGIDVALIYRYDRFRVINSRPIELTFPGEPESKTRDILYVTGKIVGSNDTLHILVNHWPSRYGGYAATIEKRNRAADVVRQTVDSIRQANSGANVLIMGDLNDYPTDISVVEHLKAKPSIENTTESDLINLMYTYQQAGKIGSHKYQEKWGVLDQIIVSQPLLKRKTGLRVAKEGAVIYRADFLLVPDETYLGVKTNRTFIGSRYNGGYSDHLPVFVDLEW